MLRVALFLVALISAGAPAAETHPFSVQDMLAMDRISDPQVSPDGRQIVFVLRTTDVEANKGRTDLWLINADGTGLRRLTAAPESDNNPRWSPDGKSIYFLSTRSGSSQAWKIALDGGEAAQVTKEPLDVSNLVVSPDGKMLAYSMDVFPDLNSPDETKKRMDELAKRKASGRVYDQLFFRHWDTWKDGRRSHLFVNDLAAGRTVDVTLNMEVDIPIKPFGGTEELAFSPDNKLIIFTARNVSPLWHPSAYKNAAKKLGERYNLTADQEKYAAQTLERKVEREVKEADPAKREVLRKLDQRDEGEAWSTNGDLFAAPVGGAAVPRVLTAENKALDAHPVFSPDGKTLAYLAMARPGYEADKQTIMLMGWSDGGPDGKPRALTEKWDRSADDIVWSADGKTIYTAAYNVGQKSLFAIDVASGDVNTLVKDGTINSPAVAGDRIVYLMDNLRSPAELFSVKPDGSDATQLTNINAARVAAARMGDFEQFSFKGANGDDVYGYIVKPVDFDPAKKYPIAYLIHGGPQGSFGNNFHYRWNPQAYAGAGYAAIMVDFHGSTGYGQAFCDAIRGDWGGKPLEDLKKGLDAAITKYPWLDGQRAAALGASYGGYMVNWIAGNWPGRFRCLVSHDGNLDERMAYYDTEELWFPEWEHGGTPWDNPEGYTKHNPQDHVKKWDTPILVIHGGLDFRVVETQGMSTFTAAQRRGIPSKFLYFPDENHWVLKPANSVLWHETVLGWLDQWTKP